MRAHRQMFAALNIAYEEPERRTLVQFYLSALTFTVLGILGGLAMLLAILYVPILFASIGFSSAFELLIWIGRWPFLALLVLSLLALLYRFGPCRRNAKWRWVSVGSLFATTVWLVASVLFSIYVSNFAHYDKTYGFPWSRDHSAILAVPFILYRAPRSRDKCRA